MAKYTQSMKWFDMVRGQMSLSYYVLTPKSQSRYFDSSIPRQSETSNNKCAEIRYSSENILFSLPSYTGGVSTVLFDDGMFSLSSGTHLFLLPPITNMSIQVEKIHEEKGTGFSQSH